MAIFYDKLASQVAQATPVRPAHDLRVVITGTRNGREDFTLWMHAFIRDFGRPALLIVGDAPGVDAQAFAFARNPFITCQKVGVNHALPSPQRFHDRNQRMVDMARAGDVCLGFPDSDSRGTWDCLRRAKQAGLHGLVLPPFDAARSRPWAHLVGAREE